MLVVSHDSKYLFSTNNECLNVFSLLSGELVYRLSYSLTHQDRSINESLTIRSLCINPLNKYQLLSFHANGRVCLWDYEDGLLLKSFETKLFIKKIIKTESIVYAVGKLKSESESTESSLSLYKFYLDDSLKTSSEIEYKLILSNLNLNQDKMAIAIDNQAKYVAYIEGTKHIVVQRLKKKHSNDSKRIKSKKELTCLVIHPHEDCIAAGTINGQILLWYNILECIPEADLESNLAILNKVDNQSKNLIKPVKNTLHWHSLPVLSLNFTSEGSFLLSGGFECVLVKWMYKTGSKDFLPRLGAPLTEITPSKDNTLYAVQHSDNIIHVIGTNFNILQTFSGFVCPNFGVKNTTDTFYPAGLSYFSRLNCLVTNGRPGHLQFYSQTNDKLLFNLDISDENYISPENMNKPLSQTQIECVAFNYDSTWLVTVERRDDLVTTPETRLKFWHYNQTNNKFSLNTFVKQPHSFDRITRIKFKPNQNVLFTCGEDGCFKSWILRENRQQALNKSKETTFNWVYDTCNGFRDMSPTDIEFLTLNQETDLIAVSFNHITTIWLYEHGGITFVNELIHCDTNDHVKYIKFVKTDHLLVIHEKFVNLWSINGNKDTNIVMKCIWSSTFENIVYVCENPSNKSQILLINNDGSYKNQNKPAAIQVNVFDLYFDGYIKKVSSFNTDSTSRLNFICMKRAELENGLNSSPGEVSSILNNIDLFYCDNRGIVERVADKSQQKSSIDVDLTDSMWLNRKSLTKNLPKSNLTTIIDIHKSNKLSQQINDYQIENEKNTKFEANLRKIESTPAYLLPKVSSFCSDILKSMLMTYNEENNIESVTVKEESNKMITDSESSSDDEDDYKRKTINNGLNIKQENFLILN